MNQQAKLLPQPSRELYPHITAREQFIFMLGILRHGEILDLHIRNGEPVMDPLPRMVFRQSYPVIRNVLTAMGPRHWSALDRLFKEMGRIGDGEIRRLEVRNSCPLLLEGGNSR